MDDAASPEDMAVQAEERTGRLELVRASCTCKVERDVIAAFEAAEDVDGAGEVLYQDPSYGGESPDVMAAFAVEVATNVVERLGRSQKIQIERDA